MDKIILSIWKKSIALQKRIVLPEPQDKRVLEAGIIAAKKNLARIIFIGDAKIPKGTKNLTIIKDHKNHKRFEAYAKKLAEIRKEKGLTLDDARSLLSDEMYFAAMMVEMGDADGVVSGAIHPTSHTLKPAFQIIKTKPGTNIASGIFLMMTGLGPMVFGDCAVNPSPSPQELSEIAINSAESFKSLVGKTPITAMLSFSTKGSANSEIAKKVKLAAEIAKKARPDLIIDGEMQLDAAIVPEVAKLKCKDSPVKGRANVLIFPDLNSGNIGYKLVERFGKAKAIGPIIQGLNKPINDLSRGCSIEDVVNMIAITSAQAK